MSNSQLKKLESGIQSGTEVTLKLSPNVAVGSNDENNFPHNLLLTITKIQSFVKLLQMVP